MVRQGHWAEPFDLAQGVSLSNPSVETLTIWGEGDEYPFSLEGRRMG